MEISDAGYRPELLVAELHRQLGDIAPPIPVHQIAKTLGIVEIKEQPLASFEGCLVTDPERIDGDILVNASSSWKRRRFTVGHELAHFLCGWHEQTDEHGFRCTKSDMLRVGRDADDRDQEAEANRFAIELLAPQRFLRRYLGLSPDLDHVWRLSDDLQISREAAARRYAELHRRPVSLVFAQNGRCRGISRREDFPWIALASGDPLPALPRAAVGGQVSDVIEADPEDWLSALPRGELGLQVLWQQEGFQIVMLSL